MKKSNILLAGASGYLGGHLLNALVQENINTRVIVRNPDKIKLSQRDNIEVIKAEVTQEETLDQVCKGIDTVISTIGITRQKDGLTYEQVDYQANMNLLNAAKKANVRRFIYVSAINADKYRHVKLLEAKEAFVDELKQSGLSYLIIRPNGFFSDMRDFLDMARKGQVYLFGDGEKRFNPIHGEDLAQFMLENLQSEAQELSIGGIDVLSFNQTAELAFSALNKPNNIMHLPDWMRRATLGLLRTFTSVKTYGPIEFFLTLMAHDNIAPVYQGKHRLRDFFIANKHEN